MKTWIYDLLDEMLDLAWEREPRRDQGRVVIETCLLILLAS